MVILTISFIATGMKSDDPYVFVKQIASATFAQMKQDKKLIKSDPDALKQIVEQQLMPHIDYVYAALSVLGTSAKDIPREKLDLFFEQFRLYLLTTYTLSLSSYTNQIVEFEQYEFVSVDELIWIIIEKKAIEYPESKVSFILDLVATDSHLLTIRANRYLLLIALLNIVDNAIKFSVPKEVVVTASQEKGQLVLQVIDQGMGIVTAETESVFEMFFRSNRTHHIKGTGLGLYITNQILSRHQIAIQLNSDIDKGTTIALHFP